MKRQAKMDKWNLTQPKNGLKLTDKLYEAMNNQELEIFQAKYAYKKSDDKYELIVDARVQQDDVSDKVIRFVVNDPVISRISELDDIVGAKIKGIGDTIVTSALRNASKIITDVIRTHKVDSLPKFTISSYQDDDYDQFLAKASAGQTVSKDEYVTYTEKMNKALVDDYLEKIKF